MNQRAADILIEAGLRGVPQIQGEYRKGDGRCALGVLLDAYGIKYYKHSAFQCTSEIAEEYGFSPGEMYQVIKMNDAGVDFIGIARKMLKEEGT